jgi:hypothetical protein
MRWRQWARVLFENQGAILQVAAGALKLKFASRPKEAGPVATPEQERLPASSCIPKESCSSRIPFVTNLDTTRIAAHPVDHLSGS